MQNATYASARSTATSLRGFRTAPLRLSSTATKKKPSTFERPPKRQKTEAEDSQESVTPPGVTRNEVGVQLLSRNIHSQIFGDVAFPPPDSQFVQISRDHLASHKLDPSQGSVLPEVSFTLPSLQGKDIDEHFHRIGHSVAEPILSLSKDFASQTLPPQPESWVHQAGWTKYYPDGSYEHVADLGQETLLCFDVETMPPYHPYAIMACAASPNAWYSWISPWLLGSDSDPAHLIPLGDPTINRVVVGHNVSYDRARILEEYHVKRTQNRFLDTMALHVAVKGISSGQRPSWMSHRKARQEDKTRKAETIAAIATLLHDAEEREKGETSVTKRSELARIKADMEESLPLLFESPDEGEDDLVNGSQRWEDITSVNSLAEVARLHCGIDVDKAPRDDFMKCTPDTIRADLDSYLTYCAQDVRVTHDVYRKVLPQFLIACPSPVTFAGVCTMGNSFLPVDDNWDRYLENAETRYRTSEQAIVSKLITLASDARGLLGTGAWKDDPWLSQLDWSPKIPGPSRGVAKSDKTVLSNLPTSAECSVESPEATAQYDDSDFEVYGPRADGRFAVPAWHHDIFTSSFQPGDDILRDVVPFVLGTRYKGNPIFKSSQYGWVFRAPYSNRRIAAVGGLTLSEDDTIMTQNPIERVDPKSWGWVHVPNLPKSPSTLGRLFVKRLSPHVFNRSITASPRGLPVSVLEHLCDDELSDEDIIAIRQRGTLLLSHSAKGAISKRKWGKAMLDPSHGQLNWTPIVYQKGSARPGCELKPLVRRAVKGDKSVSALPPTPGSTAWPKWYWELAAPSPGKPPGELDLTVRTRVSPLLLKLSWLGWPLFHSRQHGWLFRVSPSALKDFQTRQPKVSFAHKTDELLQRFASEGYAFFKLPHKDGDKANVGSPLSKTFVPYSVDGTLSSPGDIATDALAMNAECSYWISARDRILKQIVVRNQPDKVDIGISEPGNNWGIILPQVITMGTVTRRAIEKTWLTASNAKKNRVGSELKAMVRAPEGYAIVGADVDSEELWISSVMGDAQFGLHGATAIGWMTLEGAKAAGTDLHSKTASILNISRDQAKVFNYSRIYGAGMKHAQLLLLQSNPTMLADHAQQLAENLYASTKGKNTHKSAHFGRKFWYGGTESFAFNKLEEIALSDHPQTPALGCGVTNALSKEHLPEGFGYDFMPSRINWVVQSSGVDYLHLLITAMEYLITTYDIDARYLISVHDELRYLVREKDKYRAAMALQIANLWTRSLFAYRLGFDDLPQGVAFFSAVDVDRVLRKEVDMTCVTPSQPIPIPPGESLNITRLLQLTNGGSLWPEGRPVQSTGTSFVGSLDGYHPHNNLSYRAHGPNFLRAQATRELSEIKVLARKELKGR